MLAVNRFPSVWRGFDVRSVTIWGRLVKGREYTFVSFIWFIWFISFVRVLEFPLSGTGLTAMSGKVI